MMDVPANNTSRQMPLDASAIHLATVKDDLLEMAVQTDQHLSSRLGRVAGVLNNPGEGRFLDGIPQRVRHMVGLEMADFHDSPRGCG